MKSTLLEMVQHIASAMDSDEVNDINDTVESTQIALLLKQCYYDCATDLNLEEQEDLIQLEPSIDINQPCLMTTPTNVTRVDWIKYDLQTVDDPTIQYVQLEFLPLANFIESTQAAANNSNTDTQLVQDDQGDDYTFYFETDRHPRYYTVFGNHTLLFDAYDSAVDSTLQKSKTLCFGARYSNWTMSNSFIPDLEATQFSYLINRAKSKAFVELKQQQNPDASGEARRQKIIIQKRKRKVFQGTEFDRLPKYGRTGRLYQERRYIRGSE